MYQPPAVIHLEAEDAEAHGTEVARSASGFSGNGYATGFDQDGDKIVFRFSAVAGIYAARIGYRTPSGEKGFDLDVNGAKLSGMFPKTGERFAVHRAGKVELKNGQNTVALEKGWGYYDIDFVEFAPAARSSRPRKPPKRPVNARSSARTRALLGTLVDQYGISTLSGQYDLSDAACIQSATGKSPAILGSDLIEYSPSRRAHGSDPKQLSEKLIQSVRRDKYLLTLSWHWNAPKDLLDKMITTASGETVDARWYKGFYTNATTFDLARALSNTGSEDYKLLLRDIGVIAKELKKFADADIPILWRPLHEAEGGWFWWGAKGPEPFKKLWRLLYTQLTDHDKLHNLLWVFTTGTNFDWYPGDRYVDILGVDAYPTDVADPLSGIWETLRRRYDGKKLLALTEFGGVPDIPKMRRFGVYWSYFTSWTGDLGPKKLSKPALQRIYQAPGVRNRGDIRLR